MNVTAALIIIVGAVVIGLMWYSIHEWQREQEEDDPYE